MTEEEETNIQEDIKDSEESPVLAEEDSVPQKSVKTRKPYIMTEKRKAALEKANKVRMESQRKMKQLESYYEESKQKLHEEFDKRRKAFEAGVFPDKKEDPEEEVEEEEEIPIEVVKKAPAKAAQKQNKKGKKKAPPPSSDESDSESAESEESSSEEEESSDSDSSEEDRKKRKKGKSKKKHKVNLKKHRTITSQYVMKQNPFIPTYGVAKRGVF